MKTALLVIDVQNEYFTGKLNVTYPSGSLANILKAMDASSAGNIPVIVIQHAATSPESPVFRKGSHGWELHPEVASKQHSIIIEKNLPGSFTGTNLEEYLKREQINRLVISGYMTQMCCDTTARQAFHMGYEVIFLSDATGTLSIKNYAGEVTAEELHRSILITQAMRFSKVMETEEWLKSLE